MSDLNDNDQSSIVNDSFKSQDTHGVKSTVDLKMQRYEWCEIEYGYNSDRDFVMHFSSWHDRRLILSSSVEKVMRIIITYLDEVIPDEIEKSVFPPPENWEKKLFTVIARKAGEKWNFDDDKVKAALDTIGEMINQEIVKYVVKKSYM
jgi:hypothetical protein